jgi:hypothetical protein
VTGTFWSPQGPAGSFTGTYRLERLLDQYGQTAAAGIFTGELVGADGEHLGMASRRHTAAAELNPAVNALARVGPVDVNLLGFLVTVNEFIVAVPRALSEPSTAHLLATTGELLGQMVSVAGAGRAGGSSAAAREAGTR